MPSFTNQVSNLDEIGPILEISVGPTSKLKQVLTRHGKPVPAPQRVIAMIDTGAAKTLLTPSVIQALGLSPVGATKISTPTTVEPVLVRQFDVSLVLPDEVGVESAICVEAPLGGQPIQCLIGRDILQHGVLVYIGYANQFTLSF